MCNDIILSSDLVKPDLVFYQYTDQIYKIIKNKCTSPRICVDSDKFQHYDSKLDSSLSRARKTILELALCNDWKYFCTFTLDKSKFNRENLEFWHKSFTQWIRDFRKQSILDGYSLSFSFLLIPELHSDGKSWHMHGLFSDISPYLVSFKEIAKSGQAVPIDLLNGDFYNWPAYSSKFGFCSFGVIRDPVACAFYVTKYITKSFSGSSIPVGASLYYCSRPLKRAVKHGEIYGSTHAFDKFLTNHYEFCSTGMTKVSDRCDWSFGFEYMDFESLEPCVISDSVLDQADINDFYFVQHSFLEE